MDDASSASSGSSAPDESSESRSLLRSPLPKPALLRSGGGELLALLAVRVRVRVRVGVRLRVGVRVSTCSAMEMAEVRSASTTSATPPKAKVAAEPKRSM